MRSRCSCIAIYVCVCVCVCVMELYMNSPEVYCQHTLYSPLRKHLKAILYIYIFLAEDVRYLGPCSPRRLCPTTHTDTIRQNNTTSLNKSEFNTDRSTTSTSSRSLYSLNRPSLPTNHGRVLEARYNLPDDDRDSGTSSINFEEVPEANEHYGAYDTRPSLRHTVLTLNLGTLIHRNSRRDGSVKYVSG
jgi:hypothetical protein